MNRHSAAASRACARPSGSAGTSAAWDPPWHFTKPRAFIFPRCRNKARIEMRVAAFDPATTARVNVVRADTMNALPPNLRAWVMAPALGFAGRLDGTVPAGNTVYVQDHSRL